MSEETITILIPIALLVMLLCGILLLSMKDRSEEREEKKKKGEKGSPCA